MKKVFTFLLSLNVGLFCHSQLRVAVIGGLQSTGIKEENNISEWEKNVSPFYTNRLGGNIGLLGEFPLGTSARWYLQPGLLFQTKGNKYFKRNDSSIANLTDTVSVSKTFFNSYIEFPLNLAYKLPIGKKSSFFLSAGPYVSFFYNGSQSVQTRLNSNNAFRKEENGFEVGKAPNKIKTLDFGINGRAGFDLGNVLVTGFFSQGFTSFYTAPYEGTFKHKVIGASVGFWLNKVKKPEKKPVDTDQDGITDKQDVCPTLPGSEKTWGCPDNDGDTIADIEDSCRDIPGIMKYKGCPIPDSDHDSINDEEDKCPLLAGTSKYNGCPVPDTDGDGLSDEGDMCPDKAGPVEFHGCPIQDSDGDGVNDVLDKCPDEKGIAENKGCPEIRQEIIEKVNYAASNIFFHSKSDKLTSESDGPLKEVVKILENNPLLHLQIEGHTDNTGKESDNLILSERRAIAVKKQLIYLGIDENRLKATGFGQQKPIADNKSIEGRAKNRRVELKPVHQ
jgi:outer membrane protein OmpA-like peptidoglycan-associated protein